MVKCTYTMMSFRLFFLLFSSFFLSIKEEANTQAWLWHQVSFLFFSTQKKSQWGIYKVMPRTVWCHTVFTSSSFYILHFSVLLLLLLLFDISIKQGSWHFYGWQVDEEKKKSKKKKKSYPCHLVSLSFLRVLVQMCPGTSLMWLFMFMFVCLFAYLFSGKKKNTREVIFVFLVFFLWMVAKLKKKEKRVCCFVLYKEENCRTRMEFSI